MGKKKGQRLDPTFVNLKSNTMKNTVAKVRTFLKSARKHAKQLCYITLFMKSQEIFQKMYFKRRPVIGQDDVK